MSCMLALDKYLRVYSIVLNGTFSLHLAWTSNKKLRIPLCLNGGEKHYQDLINYCLTLSGSAKSLMMQALEVLWSHLSMMKAILSCRQRNMHYHFWISRSRRLCLWRLVGHYSLTKIRNTGTGGGMIPKSRSSNQRVNDFNHSSGSQGQHRLCRTVHKITDTSDVPDTVGMVCSIVGTIGFKSVCEDIGRL